MDFKLKNLQDKVYRKFIRGEYGSPKIPNKNEVIQKILEMTELDANPIMSNDKMLDINIEDINKKFNNTIDDIDIIFDTIEDESAEILDQLTNSLKEHSGVKRELAQLNTRIDDISAGKLGTEYLQYTFTENFNNLNYIDSFKSSPIDIAAKQFYIKKNASKTLTLNHYNGKKLEFSIVQNFSKLEDYGYVGSSDAGVVLDPNDPRALTYRIKTNKASPIKVITSIQLSPTTEFIEINSVTIDIDSRQNKGQVRIYYRGTDSAWHDVTPLSILDIKGDRLHFNFDPVKTSHVKFEFIKNLPDSASTNEYFIILRSLSISSNTSLLYSAIQSKPIEVSSYSEEYPIVESIKSSVDVDLPQGTNYKLFVARDIVVSGVFKDKSGNVVNSDSANIVAFDSTHNGSVFLSELKNMADTVSGVAIYQSKEYDWIQIQDINSTGENIPKSIEFNITSPIDKTDNSIYTDGNPSYLFGDKRFSGPWPTGVGDWYLTGWCNSENEFWESNLSELVNSGILVSGINIADLVGVTYSEIEDANGNLHPLISGHASYSGQWLGYSSGIGYAYGHISDVTNSTIKFGEYTNVINGLYRPISNAVTPFGISEQYTGDDGQLLDPYKNIIPDFYFNGSNFWKIYKFGSSENVITPSIRIYTYQEKPLYGDAYFYPHQFIWKYKSSWGVKTGTALELTSKTQMPTFEGYKIDISNLFSNNEEYILDGIIDIRVHNTNIVLNTEDYILTPMSSTPTQIDLTPLFKNRPDLVPTGAAFDVQYTYKIKNQYESTWSTFAIISESAINPNMYIQNVDDYNKSGTTIINKIDIENLSDGSIETISSTDDVFDIIFKRDPNVVGDQHYKIIIYCASDESTGFCAKYNSTSHWIPYDSMKTRSINVSQGVRLVSNLTPLKIVDMGSLMYGSSIYNSRKAAIYNTLDNKKYIVVKEPSKDNFPGYYFDSIKREFFINKSTRIENKDHWVRRYNSSDYTDTITYTTGSSGTAPGNVYITTELAELQYPDRFWNGGSCLSKYQNTNDGVYYPTHTTYGYPINLNSNAKELIVETYYDGDIDTRAPNTEQGHVGSIAHSGWLQSTYPSEFSSYMSTKISTGSIKFYSVSGVFDNKGFLFYNTAENLPTYYSISYKVINAKEKGNNRFLYKLVLNSNNDGNLSPVVKSVKFIINEEYK